VPNGSGFGSRTARWKRLLGPNDSGRGVLPLLVAQSEANGFVSAAPEIGARHQPTGILGVPRFAGCIVLGTWWNRYHALTPSLLPE
jgi:hypothetical protein